MGCYGAIPLDATPIHVDALGDYIVTLSAGRGDIKMGTLVPIPLGIEGVADC